MEDAPDRLLDIGLKASDIVCSALRMSGCPEDGALVILQNSEPVRDVGSVILTWREGQFQVGAQKCRTKLGHEHFFGIAFVGPLLSAEFTVISQEIDRLARAP
jgi:hypothetical protein